jgi:hypothetical protein
MAGEQSEIRREIESTRADLVEKISTLETRVGGAIEEIKRLSDIKYQVEHRPWLMVGLSAVTGYVMSRIIFARPRREASHRHRKIAAGSLVGGIVTSAAVALARDVAAHLFRRWDTPWRERSERGVREEERRLH